VLRDTAAAYLLGVEPLESDRDGKAHRISVKVKVPNAEVRSRKEFVMPKAEAKPATLEEALAAAFRSDRLQTALPIRVATHSLAASGRGGYRVLLSADIGDTNAGPVEMRFLYAFVDVTGKTLQPVAQKAMLKPRAGGPPGAVAFTAENTLPQGTYTLRFAAVDAAGRVGSVDHAFAVGLTKGDTVRMSDLLLLEPRQHASDLIEVVTDGELRGYAADAYLEVAPGSPSARVTGVTFGIGDKPDAAPLISAEASLSRPEKTGHWAAGARLNLTLLPPGDYVLTATVLDNKRTVGRTARPIRIERTVPVAAGATASPRVSFAAGESGSLVKAFSRQDVLGRDTLDYFLGRLRTASPDAATDASPAAAAAALLDARYDMAMASLVPTDPKLLSTTFLKGLALFGKGELELAAAQFRAALDTAPDFLPAAFYLGACYAAGRRDREAVGAWQTALITESDARIIYDVLGDALLRLQDGDESANLLREARDKWADDDRLVPRLAASEALRRNPQEAVSLLDGYIARHPSDAEALLLALRLLYEAKSAGGRISTAADDIASARRYADLYKAAAGPNQALVDRWVGYISGK
jgi:tetratricopeptide (TPR) repeat protein